MSSDVVGLIELATLVGGAIVSQGLFGYAAYWAFRIQGALFVGVYRHQALGVGLVSLGWILIFFNNIIFSAANNIVNAGLTTQYVPFFVVQCLVGILLFYFVDVSVLAARRSDPLLRNTLHWSRLRLFLWGLNITLAVLIVALVAYFQVYTGSEPQLMLVYGGYAQVYVIEPPSLLALAISGMRSKDMFLRKQLVWFAAFLGSVFVITDFSRVTNFGPGIFVGLMLGGYCLYRSAKSLAPLNRISPAMS